MSVHEVRFPFVRETYTHTDYDEEGVNRTEAPTWRPGTRFEQSGPHGDEAECRADGVGRMKLVEVSRHKPGKYPERVFYTRSFVDPDGREFGKACLRVATAGVFRRLCAGYRWPYEVRPIAEARP